MQCSKCAELEPSFVTAVHLSFKTIASGPPRVHHRLHRQHHALASAADFRSSGPRNSEPAAPHAAASRCRGPHTPARSKIRWTAHAPPPCRKYRTAGCPTARWSIASSSDFLVTSQQFLRLLADLADRHRERRIAVIPVQLHARIDRNDVALLQHPFRVRHAMNDLAVHRSAQHKPVLLTRRRHIITFEGRPRPGVRHHLYGGDFQVPGCHPFHRDLPQLLQIPARPAVRCAAFSPVQRESFERSSVSIA